MWKFSVLLSLILLTGCMMRAGGRTRYTMNNNPNYSFGVTGDTESPQADGYIRDLGVGWERIPVRWGELEPSPGVTNWDVYQKKIADYHRRRPNMYPLVMLRCLNRWKQRPGYDDVRGNISVPPANMDEWRAFVYRMAVMGKGVVKAWQVENEQDSESWWAGSVQDYLELLQATHEEVKRADPDALVVLGGWTSEVLTVAAMAEAGYSAEDIFKELGRDPSEVDIEAVKRTIQDVKDVIVKGQQHYDVVDVHLYHRYETIGLRINWVKKILSDNNIVAEIWATEVGGPDPLVVPYSEKAQADEVRNRVNLVRSEGVKFFWLSLRDFGDSDARFGNMGLVKQNWTKKPAYFAYQKEVRGRR